MKSLKSFSWTASFTSQEQARAMEQRLFKLGMSWYGGQIEPYYPTSGGGKLISAFTYRKGESGFCHNSGGVYPNHEDITKLLNRKRRRIL